MRKLQVGNKVKRTQLDTCLDETTLEFDFLEQMDVLMARDLLSIPITIVALEFAFSIRH